jgi:hypothetical protein
MALDCLRRIVYATVFMPALGLLAVAPVGAAEGEIFTVAGVPVDATADTAAAAREVALAEGQRRALDILLRRLTLREDHGRLPQPADAHVAELVKALEIANERTSAVRYLAELTVRFNPEGVRSLLRLEGVNFAETVRKPVLVLPVYRIAGTPLLWDEPNPWRHAWAARPPVGGLVPLILPIGDLPDIADLSAEEALRGDVDRLDAIARRYDVDGAIVAIAELGLDGASRLPVLTVAARHHGGDAFAAAAGERRMVGAETLDALLPQAVQAVVDDIEEAWKRDNLLRFDLQGTIEVLVPVGGIEEWVEVRRRLRQVPAIRHARLRSLTRNRAALALSYVGEARQLAVALGQQDLELEERFPAWVLRLRRPLAEPEAAPFATLPLSLPAPLPPAGAAAAGDVVSGGPAGQTSGAPGPLPDRPLFQKRQ